MKSIRVECVIGVARARRRIDTVIGTRMITAAIAVGAIDMSGRVAVCTVLGERGVSCLAGACVRHRRADDATAHGMEATLGLAVGH